MCFVHRKCVKVIVVLLDFAKRATWIVEGKEEDFFNQPSLTGPHACLLHCLLIFQSHLNANEGPRGHSIHKRDAPLSNASSLPTAPLRLLPVEILLVSPVVSRSNRQIEIWKVFGPPSQVAVQRADSMDEEGTST